MKSSRIILGLLRIPMDLSMGILAFLTAYQLRTVTDLIPGMQLPLDIESFPDPNVYLQFAAAATAVLIALLATSRLYSLKSQPTKSRETGKIIVTSIIWFMLILGWFFLIREFPFSRLVLVYSWVLTILFILIGRTIIHAADTMLLKAGIGRTRLLFIGKNSVTEKLVHQMKKERQYDIVDIIENHDISELETFMKKHRVEKIIQTSGNVESVQSADILDFCRTNHLEYSFVPDILSVQQRNVEVETINGIPVLQLKPTPLDGWGRVLKRSFDLVGALIGLIVLSPIFLIIAIAIKLDSKGTVFYKFLDDGKRVKRVGQQGKLFHFYKFRTMRPGSHNLRYTDLAEHDTRQGAPVVKIKNDPRVTRVGKFLRKTSMDELPQLYSVLKGQMSLVGPRPHLPEEVAKYQKHHRFVLTIKPGITGMAQVSGRSDLDFEEEVKLDTWYIEHWSLWLDLMILLKTIKVVFRPYEE